MAHQLPVKASQWLLLLSLLLAALCFIAIFPMPYSYFVFLRWMVSLVAILMSVAFVRAGNWGVAVFSVCIAILFNPITKVPLGRDTWKWFDAGAGLFFLFFCMIFMIYGIRASPPSTSAPSSGSLSGKLEQIALNAEVRIRDRAKRAESERPSEVEEALAVLEGIAGEFDSAAFGLVADRVEATILANPEEFCKMIRSGNPVSRWVWGAVSNTAGDLVESGEFHSYRGMLNPAGPGVDLVRIFDAAVDEMVRLGAAKPKFAAQQKANLRRNITEVG